jgi:hypothetical protein
MAEWYRVCISMHWVTVYRAEARLFEPGSSLVVLLSWLLTFCILS